jgi:hypothetical protein
MQVCFCHVVAFLKVAPILLTSYNVSSVISKFEPAYHLRSDNIHAKLA